MYTFLVQLHGTHSYAGLEAVATATGTQHKPEQTHADSLTSHDSFAASVHQGQRVYLRKHTVTKYDGQQYSWPAASVWPYYCINIEFVSYVQ